MRNIIPSFTKDEIINIQKNGNLTKDEQTLLNLRNQEQSLEVCAEYMNCSVRTISRINKKLMTKISKISFVHN